MQEAKKESFALTWENFNDSFYTACLKDSHLRKVTLTI